jgi:SAM-dependent methyltransferase
MESDEKIRETVRKGYTEIAKGKSGCGCGCGSSSAGKLAEGIGYTSQELEIVPDGANMGLSCGNPTAVANLKPGQVVLDLGSGGGFDVFIAAKKVGPQGKTIGVDMTPDMLNKARAGISKFTQKNRTCKCRVQTWRNRTSAGRRFDCRCDNFQLRNKSFA